MKKDVYDLLRAVENIQYEIATAKIKLAENDPAYSTLVEVESAIASAAERIQVAVPAMGTLPN